MAVLSVAIGLGVAIDWHPKAFLALAVVLNLAYCVLGQGFGGILTGSATDPNAGVLFILLAAGLSRERGQAPATTGQVRGGRGRTRQRRSATAASRPPSARGSHVSASSHGRWAAIHARPAIAGSLSGRPRLSTGA